MTMSAMGGEMPQRARTSTAPSQLDERDGPADDTVEVATISADTLRASIRVTGTLVAETAPLLTSVLSTHVCAGRRYLRVDLSAAQITESAVVEALVVAHRSIADIGGMLVFENAGPRVIDAVRNDTLYVRSAD